jgi:MFS family permease
VHHDGRLHRNHADPSIDVDSRRRTIALAVLCLCAFTTAIDITITNVALPFIGNELDASTSQRQWVIDAYTIALAGLLVLGGGMADRLGRRKVFLSGYSIFGLACVLDALSGVGLVGAAARDGFSTSSIQVTGHSTRPRSRSSRWQRSDRERARWSGELCRSHRYGTPRSR